jgi:hypothetical protein
MPRSGPKRVQRYSLELQQQLCVDVVDTEED